MPTLEFSENFMQSSASANNVMGRIVNYRAIFDFGTNINAGLWTNYAGGWASQACQITIMKGVVPTNITALTSFADRSADVLITYDSAADNLSPSATTYYLSPAVFTSVFVTASASGTATWFWWTCRPANGPTPQNTLNQQIIGTVGLTGGGDDLEIPNTSIVAGQLYRISDLRLQLPRIFVY